MEREYGRWKLHDPSPVAMAGAERHLGMRVCMGMLDREGVEGLVGGLYILTSVVE